MRAFSCCNVSRLRLANTGSSAAAISRVFFQHGLAHDRCRRIDDLRALVVAQRNEAKRGEFAVGAVGHPGIDPGDALGRRPQRRRRVAARQGQELVRAQVKPVGLLERGQRRRTLDELGRSRKLQPAAIPEPRRQIVEAFPLRKARQVAADGDHPGVVRGRRPEPDEAVRLAVQRFHRFIAGGGVLPDRIALAMKEEGAVAGVFGVDVDLSGKQRGAHDIGRPKLHLVLDRQSAGFQSLGDHVAEQRALGVGFRGDDDRPGGRHRRAVQGDGRQRQSEGGGQAKHGDCPMAPVSQATDVIASEAKQSRAVLPQVEIASSLRSSQ